MQLDLLSMYFEVFFFLVQDKICLVVYHGTCVCHFDIRCQNR